MIIRDILNGNRVFIKIKNPNKILLICIPQFHFFEKKIIMPLISMLFSPGNQIHSFMLKITTIRYLGREVIHLDAFKNPNFM